jgi:transposase
MEQKPLWRTKMKLEEIAELDDTAKAVDRRLAQRVTQAMFVLPEFASKLPDDIQEDLDDVLVMAIQLGISAGLTLKADKILQAEKFNGKNSHSTETRELAEQLNYEFKPDYPSKYRRKHIISQELYRRGHKKNDKPISPSTIYDWMKRWD